MSEREACPLCGAPEWEDAYVQGEIWKCGNGHTNYTSAMCEYTAGLRAERDRYRAALERIGGITTGGSEEARRMREIAREALEHD